MKTKEIEDKHKCPAGENYTKALNHLVDFFTCVEVEGLDRDDLSICWGFVRLRIKELETDYANHKKEISQLKADNSKLIERAVEMAREINASPDLICIDESKFYKYSTVEIIKSLKEGNEKLRG